VCGLLVFVFFGVGGVGVVDGVCVFVLFLFCVCVCVCGGGVKEHFSIRLKHNAINSSTWYENRIALVRFATTTPC